MSNAWLRRRSDTFAGGVVASGVFDLTQPTPIVDIDELAVAVTWGGDNDEYTGETNGTAVPEINFAEQAALASQFWENEPGVHQIHCRGNELGHTWLPATPFFIDFLLAHPKGLPVNDAWSLSAPAGGLTCSEDVAEYVQSLVVECSADPGPECQAHCQFAADCIVENGTVAPVLGPQLEAIGFSGTDFAECGGCVSGCEDDLALGDAADPGVVSCFAATDSSSCGGGVDGALPFIDAINACCQGQTTSAICTRLCVSINQNDIAKQLIPTCAAWE